MLERGLFAESPEVSYECILLLTIDSQSLLKQTWFMLDMTQVVIMQELFH